MFIPYPSINRITPDSNSDTVLGESPLFRSRRIMTWEEDCARIIISDSQTDDRANQLCPFITPATWSADRLTYLILSRVAARTWQLFFDFGPNDVRNAVGQPEQQAKSREDIRPLLDDTCPSDGTPSHQLEIEIRRSS